MMAYLALITILAAGGCSQFRTNDQGQFILDRLPQKGDDCTSLMQAALEWRFDPHRLSRMPGVIQFHVAKAVILVSDPFTPRPDTATSKLRISMHATAVLPSGQKIEEDSIETVDGMWDQHKFQILDFDDDLPVAFDKAGTQAIYDNLSRTAPQGSYLVDLHMASSLIVLLSSIPIQTTGNVDLEYWQRMHDQALTRKDLQDK